MATASPPTASVSQDSSAPGRLFQNGLRVRTIITMASSVISDSTNHPVWKSRSVAPATRMRNPKVMKSNTELTRPKATMKRRT